MQTPTKRKGATRLADVSPEVLAQLNAGTLETVTLAETLAMDFSILMAQVSPQAAEVFIKQVPPGEGITKRMHWAATALVATHGEATYAMLKQHPSDMVRGWAAYALALLPGLSLQQRLAQIRPLADDPHFGVREWAWLGMRGHIAADIEAAIQCFIPWVQEESCNIRRFAVESTRPRGVWCMHIQLLKATPELGLPLLHPLRAEPEKYVQDSVANWLNDAGKTRPEWVKALCAQWQQESPTPQTQRICTRALRNFKP